MSKMSKRIIASTVTGAFALGSTAVSADPLETLHKENAKTHAAAKNLKKRSTHYSNKLKIYLLNIVQWLMKQKI